MKNKKINKIITFSIIGIILFISMLIFILNYTKDDSSFSILEKKWINDYKDKVVDVSLFNDVPIYGQNGKGIVFDILERFTKDYEVEFNKIPYFADTSTASNTQTSFKVLNNKDILTDKHILLYQDNYVIASVEMPVFETVSDIKDITIGVLSSDISDVNYYLADGQNISYLTFDTVDSLFEAIKLESVSYVAIPQNLYLNYILENDLNIIYHFDELSKKYVLEVNNNEHLLTIMQKYLKQFQKEYLNDSKNKAFIDLFFSSKNISDQEKASYNSNKYVYGFVKNMPYEAVNNNQFIGTLSNYIKEFSKLVDVDFRFVEYNSIEDLRNDIIGARVDFAFANYNMDNASIDVVKTVTPFSAKYVILSKKDLVVTTPRTLKDKEVVAINNSLIFDYLMSIGANAKGYDNINDLLTNIDNDSIIVVDYDTYNYYHDKKLSNYNLIYTGTLKNNYNFIVRKYSNNDTVAKLFSYYVSSVNYNTIRYNYNSSFDIKDPNILNKVLKYLFGILVIMTLIIILIITSIKKRKKVNTIKKEEKLKFIDMMTSLKNRNYLNYNINKWDENVIYPQTIIIIDLNNIKYINDNHGHEEGDNVIKKAASILIINQLENTDIIRTDGNEFLIYMVGYDEKQIISYTRKIHKELKELPYGFGAAIGYSMITDDIKTIDDAINEATIEMRDAKEKQ
ncbi:MAG: diguanylate cyclase domain-containing protein [Bacilli bacterium]